MVHRGEVVNALPPFALAIERKPRACALEPANHFAEIVLGRFFGALVSVATTRREPVIQGRSFMSFLHLESILVTVGGQVLFRIGIMRGNPHIRGESSLEFSRHGIVSHVVIHRDGDISFGCQLKKQVGYLRRRAS
jgi:hypothetical protein